MNIKGGVEKVVVLGARHKVPPSPILLETFHFFFTFLGFNHLPTYLMFVASPNSFGFLFPEILELGRER